VRQAHKGDIIIADIVLKDYVNKGNYTHPDIVDEAPPNAPDWVREAWIPVPRDKLYSPFFGDVKTINCNPGGVGVLFIDGPMSGEIQASDPINGPPKIIKWNAGHDYAKLGGTYHLEKQSWTHGTVRYIREVYRFDPVSYFTYDLDFAGSYMPYALKGASASFDFKITEETAKILYNQASELDPWNAPEEEPALWEQI